LAFLPPGWLLFRIAAMQHEHNYTIHWYLCQYVFAQCASQQSLTMKPATVVIKKYGNRRLYDSSNSRYVNLDDIAEFIRRARTFRWWTLRQVRISLASR
jgi:hypothetical protein